MTINCDIKAPTGYLCCVNIDICNSHVFLKYMKSNEKKTNTKKIENNINIEKNRNKANYDNLIYHESYSHNTSNRKENWQKPKSA